MTGLEGLASMDHIVYYLVMVRNTSK